MTKRTHVSIGTEARSCERHGPYTATLWDIQPKPPGYPNGCPSAILDFLKPFWSQCPVCDSDIQREADESHAAIRTGKSKTDAIMAARLAEAQIPRRLDHCKFDNFSALLEGQKRALSAVKDYAYGFSDALENGRCLVLLGRPGTGKTHLAVAALVSVTMKGCTGRYTTIFDIMSKIRSTFGKDRRQSEDQVIESYVRPDLLVVDEIGKQAGTDFEAAIFFALVNKRYSERKPMLLISNLDEAGFKAFLGDSIIDRLREHGGRLIKFNWPSSRGEE